MSGRTETRRWAVVPAVTKDGTTTAKYVENASGLRAFSGARIPASDLQSAAGLKQTNPNIEEWYIAHVVATGADAQRRINSLRSASDVRVFTDRQAVENALNRQRGASRSIEEWERSFNVWVGGGGGADTTDGDQLAAGGPASDVGNGPR